MLIAAVAILSALGGLALSSYAQSVEAKSADKYSVSEWNEFVKTMGGNRR